MLPTSFLRSKSFPLVLSVSCTTEYCPLASMVSCGSTGSSMVCLCPFCTTEYTAFGPVLCWEPVWTGVSPVSFGFFWTTEYNAVVCSGWAVGCSLACFVYFGRQSVAVYLSVWYIVALFVPQSTLRTCLWSVMALSVPESTLHWAPQSAVVLSEPYSTVH